MRADALVVLGAQFISRHGIDPQSRNIPSPALEVLKSIGFGYYTDLLWWNDYKQLVLPIDHLSLGSQDPANVQETTHIGVLKITEA